MTTNETTPKKILDKLDSGVTVVNVTGEGLASLDYGSTDGGTTWVPVKVDASGHLQVDVLGDFVLVPVGSVLAWLKNYTNTPALGASFVECNGQVLDDADSVYNGQTIPNLNGNNNFLRGNATSGDTGGASTINIAHTHTGPSHTHTWSNTDQTESESSHTHTWSDTSSGPSSHMHVPDVTGAYDIPSLLHTHDVSGTTSGGSSHHHHLDISGTTSANGTGATGSALSSFQSILPPYYNVVWIMRIK